MKKDIHPRYRDVVFHDTSSGVKFLTRSTIDCKEETEYEGATYPCYKVDISSESHPFFTGKMKFVDAAGRVEKFNKKFKWGAKGKK